MSGRRRWPGVIATAAVVAAVAACGPAAPATRAATPAERPPRLAFAPCEGDPELECGTLEVPLDHDRPAGPALALAVIRARATGPGARIGALFVNHGGPGGPGVDFVRRGKARLAPLRRRFDLVSFDPRGVGRSAPKVRCDFEPPPEPAAGDAEAQARYLDEHARRFAAACLAGTGPAVARLGTNAVARDLDRLRAALGEPAISYFGASYGAELGAVYASLFPGRVRAMVLDGGVPTTFRDGTIEAFVEEAAAHELALHRLDALCRRDPACPLRGVGLVAGLERVLAKLRTDPVQAPDGRVLREADAALVAIIHLYDETRRAGRLPGLVAAALAGRYEPWLPFASIVKPGLDPDLHPYAAILCNDLGARRPAADFLPQLAAAEALYPRLGRHAELAVLLRTCQAWPAATPPIIRDVAGEVARPILLVGNDFDAATPMRWTRELGRVLGMEASVVRYQGGGHTATRLVFPGVPCIDAIVDRYLEELEVPPAGASCPAAPIVFAPAP